MLAPQILPDVYLLELLFTHPLHTSLAVELQILVYLSRYGLR